MAYTLQPLITILQQILNPQQTRWFVYHNKPQLESLLEKAASLQHILEKSPLLKIESLERQIRDAAHRAEDIIESHIVDQMHASPRDVSFVLFTPDLQQVTRELDSVMEQVVKLMEGKTTTSGTSSSGASFSGSKSVVVGVDEDLLQLKDRLTAMQKKLEIIPIVGMGGVGKTTLARKLFEDELIISCFQYRGWTTISQDYNMRAILVGLLRCIIGNALDRHIEKGNNELKDLLYQSLYGRRYFIILDDMWSTSSWDEMRKYFPDNSNGSRIILTTRVSGVAKHVESKSLQHQVQLLSESLSWDLLGQIVFGEEKCPHFLQEIGKKIARDCGGLPLAINVIGGLLSKVQKSRDVWENIANDVRVAIAESDEGFSNILSLSYNHLQNHLRPCFLYMGAFPEDYEIKGSKLVHLWIAEGFVKSNADKSLEEEAEDYLKALVERNLLLVRCYKRNGKPKSYIIHDLLRDLCLRKACEDKFLHVYNSPNVTFSLVEDEKSNGKQKRRNTYGLFRKYLCMSQDDEDKFVHVKRSPKVTFSHLRRVSINASCAMEDVYASAVLMSLARSFLSTKSMFNPSFHYAMRLLRVLDIENEFFRFFPTEIFELVNLRFLHVTFFTSVPSGISRLWNLQTFIANDGRVPFDIWELSELRHLKLGGVVWFDDKYIKRIAVQKKLQTISRVGLNHKLFEIGFFESIPNITDLGICYHDDDLHSRAVDLSHLHRLGTLRCVSSYIGSSCCFVSTLKLPSSLRKLYLDGCEVFTRMLTLLCALPNLEVLDIRRCAFERKDEEWEAADQVWETAEGDEFRSLQFLSLASLALKRWRADETNFPKLRHLVIRKCKKLEEIPSGIGDIPTLQLIELDDCSRPLEVSAEQILEVQRSDYDNYDIKLRIS